MNIVKKLDIPCYFVHTIDNSVFRLLKRKSRPGGSSIFYVQKTISKSKESALSSVYNLKYINFHKAPGEFFRYQNKCYDIIEKCFNNSKISNSLRKYSSCFNVKWDSLEVAMKKIVFNLIKEDYKIIFLGEALYPDKRKMFLVKEREIIKALKRDEELVQIRDRWKSLIKLILYYSYLVISIFKINWKGKNKSRRNGIIFDQLYSSIFSGKNPGNPEFGAFYNYFKERDDVTYICKEKSEIYHTLKKEGKPVVCFKWYFNCPRDRIKAFYDLLFLLIKLIKDKNNSSLKCCIVRLKYYEFYYQSLFKIFSPKYYIKVRSDMDYSHPIATDLIEKINGFNIGYQHGSYPGFYAIFSWIDFHIYGIWGKYFSSLIFKEAWVGNANKFLLMGPFTANPLEGFTKDINIDNGRATISMFTTSSTDDEYIPEIFYGNYLNYCYSVLSKMSVNILLKEKHYDRERDSLEQSLQKKYNLKVEKFYHHKSENIICRSSNEILYHSDVVIVMSTSSTAWEALSLLKKVIVVEVESIRHPFETVLPSIVVRNDIELRDCLEWLLSITQAEYEKIIMPLIEAWCKINDGQLVKDFWSEVESLACA